MSAYIYRESCGFCTNDNRARPNVVRDAWELISDWARHGWRGVRQLRALASDADWLAKAAEHSGCRACVTIEAGWAAKAAHHYRIAALSLAINLCLGADE